MPLTDEYLLKHLPEVCRDHRLVVGFSGGLDSTVLLHLCVALRERGKIKTLAAIHVNHGLSVNAVAWQAFCQSLCQRWSVPIVAAKGVVDIHTGKGLEASARATRYRLYEDYLERGDYLLQAHHCNDQAETLLYRIVRGCGVHGLAAIPRERRLGETVILRPLLAVSREDIHAYAESHRIEWVDDESNVDVTYDRNFLRHDVLPLLSQRWPGVLNHLGRLAEDAADAAALLDQVTETDLQQVVSDTPVVFLPDGQALEITRMSELSEYRQRNLLRYWLRRQGFPLPSRVVVQRILDELAAAAQEASPLVAWEGCEVRRHAGQIISMSPMDKLQAFSCQLNSLKPGCINLPGNGQIMIEDGHTDQKGVRVRQGLAQILLGYRNEITVSPFRLTGRQGRKSLKKWLNTLNVPAWIRDRLPILHMAGELIAIPGLLVNADYRSARHEPSILLSWQTPFGRQ